MDKQNNSQKLGIVKFTDIDSVDLASQSFSEKKKKKSCLK